MKSHRFQKAYRRSASKLHKRTGEALRASNGLFSGYRIYQEYPVNRVLKTYEDARQRFDWVILDIQLIIECHGEGHFKPVRFGGISEEEALKNFLAGTKRDESKREAAIEAGFTYIIVPYWVVKKIDEDYIWDLYKLNINDKITTRKPKKVLSAYQEAQKEASRQYRKQQYRRQKEWVKKQQLKEAQNGSPRHRLSKYYTSSPNQKMEEES